jgi:hypothetical protein
VAEEKLRFAERSRLPLCRAIMTVAHTLRKQKRHVFAYLTDACRAVLAGLPAPSLLPAVATR